MGPIKVNRTLEEEIRQVLFLHKLIRGFELKGIKKNFITLLVLTAILIGFSFFSDLDFLIGFYIVMLGTWLIFLTRFLLKMKSFHVKKESLKKTSEEKFNPDEDYFLEFNEEFVKFTTDKTSTELKWGYFRAYLAEVDTIYLLMEQVNATWSFSKDEIGVDALSDLKRIAKEKLPYLQY
ncbi:hypothetical protein [Rufibacter latericius]|uniref:YcxB family protein n=1 Tax=Rufibacter latericius TaxID=2487040 RepID=A0A3M9MT68_9BACT|nr:hypothetical protein [Rufibacter latericius]RNI28689.1 hypothetical protein EFB08_08625 [Rufibacter latericius]